LVVGALLASAAISVRLRLDLVALVQINSVTALYALSLA
jgi:hypothetical protein